MKAQTLRKQYEGLFFKEGESVDAFAMRLTNLVTTLDNFGDKIKVILKFLAVVPKQYNQIALEIETLIDLNTLTIEDLTSRLKAAEDHHDADGNIGTGDSSKLLLSEEEWFARMKLNGLMQESSRGK